MPATKRRAAVDRLLLVRCSLDVSRLGESNVVTIRLVTNRLGEHGIGEVTVDDGDVDDARRTRGSHCAGSLSAAGDPDGRRGLAQLVEGDGDDAVIDRGHVFTGGIEQTSGYSGDGAVIDA